MDYRRSLKHTMAFILRRCLDNAKIDDACLISGSAEPVNGPSRRLLADGGARTLRYERLTIRGSEIICGSVLFSCLLLRQNLQKFQSLLEQRHPEAEIGLRVDRACDGPRHLERAILR